MLDGFFPDNRVLSHDILEGNIMRCAYVGDVQFSDGFPKMLPPTLNVNIDGCVVMCKISIYQLSN